MGTHSNARSYDHFRSQDHDGKPVVRGTRITVELILEKLAAGESVDQILTGHPRLTLEGIRAAIAFAVEALRADVVYPFEKVS
jgi:uncharacterized protein (DUF433 family)